MNHIQYIGSKANIYSKKYGNMIVESAALSETIDGDMVVYFGNPLDVERPVVRIHSLCTFSEVLGSDLCDCAWQLKCALKKLADSKCGILFYLRSDGRGVGLASKIKATSLQNIGVDTFDAHVLLGLPPDPRDYSKVAEFLLNKGITKVTLLTNSPNKTADLVNSGIDVIVEPLFEKKPNDKVKYLYQTKANKFRHKIPGFR